MKSWIKIIMGLVVAGIVAAFLIYHFVINKPHPDFESLKPDYSMNAGAFYNEFKTSKENASRLYNGKVIEITGKLNTVEILDKPSLTEVKLKGKVEAIVNYDTLIIAVFIFNQGMFGGEGIRCTMLKKFYNDAKKLKPDGIIRIKGYCTGFNETDVIMEHCSLIY